MSLNYQNFETLKILKQLRDSEIISQYDYVEILESFTNDIRRLIE
tara:strand:+ start:63 stop:197 length:135 start_codon:yes stop_codon:yes gene_type:complete